MDGAEGVLACSGGEFGGWSLFLKDGKFHYAHNYLNLKEDLDVSPKTIPTGQHTLSIHFTPIEKHLKPDDTIGDVTMTVDDEKVGELKSIKVAGQYSAVTGYGLLIGRNTGTPVSHEYKAPFAFTGQIEMVTVELN